MLDLTGQGFTSADSAVETRFLYKRMTHGGALAVAPAFEHLTGCSGSGFVDTVSKTDHALLADSYKTPLGLVEIDDRQHDHSDNN